MEQTEVEQVINDVISSMTYNGNSMEHLRSLVHFPTSFTLQSGLVIHATWQIVGDQLQWTTLEHSFTGTINSDDNDLESVYSESIISALDGSHKYASDLYEQIVSDSQSIFTHPTATDGTGLPDIRQEIVVSGDSADSTFYLVRTNNVDSIYDSSNVQIIDNVNGWTEMPNGEVIVISNQSAYILHGNNGSGNSFDKIDLGSTSYDLSKSVVVRTKNGAAILGSFDSANHYNKIEILIGQGMRPVHGVSSPVVRTSYVTGMASFNEIHGNVEVINGGYVFVATDASGNTDVYSINPSDLEISKLNVQSMTTASRIFKINPNSFIFADVQGNLKVVTIDQNGVTQRDVHDMDGNNFDMSQYVSSDLKIISIAQNVFVTYNNGHFYRHEVYHMDPVPTLRTNELIDMPNIPSGATVSLYNEGSDVIIKVGDQVYNYGRSLLFNVVPTITNIENHAVKIDIQEFGYDIEIDTLPTTAFLNEFESLCSTTRFQWWYF